MITAVPHDQIRYMNGANGERGLCLVCHSQIFYMLHILALDLPPNLPLRRNGVARHGFGEQSGEVLDLDAPVPNSAVARS